jgi:predicted permease
MLNRLRLMARALLRRRLDREMREEMDAHLARATDRLIERGLTSETARAAARREFGNVPFLQEQARDARGGRWLESLVADVRFAARHFGRTPVSTLTIIVLLALGIGFNSALFTVVYSLVNMPSPGITPEESLVRIRGLDHTGGPGRTLGRDFSLPEYHEYAARRDLFGAVAAWTSSDVVLAVGDGRENLHSAAATYVTPNYFHVLQVRPIAGAGLPTTALADSGAPELVAVISHVVWDRFFERAPDVVGRTVRVNDVTVTIVGVAPREFAGTRSGGSRVRLWLPLSARAPIQHTNSSALSNYDSAFFGLAARLQPGIDPGRTIPIVDAIATRTARESARWRARPAISTDVVPLLANNYYPQSGETPSIAGRASSLLIPLLILLIPCTNVSALLVGLAVARRREIAIRLSLGAARKRIVRQLVTESTLLALAAGALGLAVIWVLLRVFGSRFPDIQLVVQWPAVAFTFGVAIATGILFGASPALHATRVGVGDVLKSAANGVATGRSRLQSGLVVTQIAMTQPLLLALGWLILTLFADLKRLPVATFGDRIVQVSFNQNARDGSTEPQREDVLRRLQQRFAAVPGVESVVPQADREGVTRVAVHPADRVPGVEYRESFHVQTRAVAPGYFTLMGLPFVRGRGFDRADQDGVAEGGGTALVIRGELARRLWGSADPIGRRLVHSSAGEQGSVAFVIVGVLDETQAGLSGDGNPRVFVPTLSRTGSILVRTSGPAEPVIPLLRSAANAEAPLMPVTSATTLAAIDADQRSTFRRVSAGAITGGVVALVLCAIGLYAVVSFAVGQRTREIGIRSALGADSHQVVGMFFVRGLRLSFAGLLIGLATSTIVVRIIALSDGTSTPASLLGLAAMIAVVVVGVSSVATWIPARRAATVDPLTMLRTE